MPAPRLDLDPDRCWAAGVPDQVGFATKPVLATKMITRALDADVPAAWVTGDVVYGADPGLRAELEGRGVGYVLAVACDHPVLAAGDSYRADALLRRVPVRAWQCVSAGASKATACTTGVVRLDDRAAHPDSQAGQHWLLARRNRTPGELAFYRCWTPPRSPGYPGQCRRRRWRAAGGSRSAFRPARAWSAWTPIRCAAGDLGIGGHAGHARPAFLVVAALTERTRQPAPSGLVPLTCNEFQHLVAALIARPAGDLGHRLRWSVWRRRHQARARTCHYHRQAAWQP